MSTPSLLKAALVCAAAAALVTGCGKKDDPVAQAGKKDVATGVPAPNIAEVKAIAEEGFIYGPPSILPVGEGTWKPPELVASK